MAGIFLTAKGELEMSEADAKLLGSIEGMLQRLNLSLYCQRCHGLGNPDGVRARNHPDDPTWIVECGCTVRLRKRRAS